MQTETTALDEALAVARLRQWAMTRTRQQHGKIAQYRRRGWQQRNDRTYDANQVRIIDFERAMNQLPDEDKVALVLHYRDGQLQPEIARAIGCSIRKVSYLLPSARRKLAAILDRLDLL